MFEIKKTLLLSLVLSLFFATVAAAATIDLTGTIRDFNADNSTFAPPKVLLTD